jgi:hypothetical protein
MKRELLLLLALPALSACATGPSAFEQRLAAIDAKFKQDMDEIPWKVFRDHGGIDTCARTVAFNRANYDSYCDKFKDRPETQAKIQQVKDDFAKLNPSPSKAEVIKAGNIRTGMTKDEVRLSWGRPYTVNRTVTSSSAHEQWVYGDEYNPKTYLYFDDGILTAWQD